VFEVDDIEAQWLYQPNSYDHIHVRFMFLAIRDFPKVLNQAFRYAWLLLISFPHLALRIPSPRILSCLYSGYHSFPPNPPNSIPFFYHPIFIPLSYHSISIPSPTFSFSAPHNFPPSPIHPLTQTQNAQTRRLH